MKIESLRKIIKEGGARIQQGYSILIFPEGALANSDYLVRFTVIIISVLIFFISKKNLVYPTVFSAIILSFLNSYF